MSYADAITAFSIVSGVTFLLALTEQDVRCSLVGRSTVVYAAMILQAATYGLLILVCHRTENRLRSAGEPLPADLVPIRRALILARISVVLLATIGSIPLVMMALDDTACLNVGA